MQELKYSASKLHNLGGKLREKGEFEKSLFYETEALEKFIKVKNYNQIIDTLQARFLTYKHIFLVSNETHYLKLAKEDAKKSLEFATKHKVKNLYSRCYFRMGEATMLENNYNDAEEFYLKALNYHRGTKSEKGDYRYHLGEALYRLNKKDEGYKTMLKGLNEIMKGKKKVDSFLYNVWLSGCFGRLAELLRKDNPSKAREYLMRADEIIKSDPRLIIRKRQMEVLKKKFKAL